MKPTHHNSRMLTIRNLQVIIKHVCKHDAALRRSFNGVNDDLDQIARALTRDPDIWRLNRALHVVHLPSLVAALSLYGDLDPMTGKEERDEIVDALSRTTALISEARKQLSEHFRTAALIEAEVLADRVPVVVDPEPTGFAGRLMRQIGQSGTEMADIVTNAATKGWSDVTTRGTGLALLGSNTAGTLNALIRDNLTGPVMVRLNAAAMAAGAGVGTGLVSGVAIAILAPPLLPLAAGAAVCAAFSGWQSGMQSLREAEAENSAARMQELNEERQRALRLITGGADVFQMESDNLSLTINAKTGTVDAIALSGNHPGRNFEDLPPAEKKALLASEKDSGSGLVDVISVLLIGIEGSL